MPPPTNSEILALACRALSKDPFDRSITLSSLPTLFVSLIRLHLQLHPDEQNFLFEFGGPQSRYPFGVVTCIEEGCFEEIILGEWTGQVEGGRREGVGAMNAYWDHCQNHPRHVRAVEARRKSQSAPSRNQPRPEPQPRLQNELQVNSSSSGLINQKGKKRNHLVSSLDDDDDEVEILSSPRRNESSSGRIGGTPSKRRKTFQDLRLSGSEDGIIVGEDDDLVEIPGPSSSTSKSTSTSTPKSKQAQKTILKELRKQADRGGMRGSDWTELKKLEEREANGELEGWDELVLDSIRGPSSSPRAHASASASRSGSAGSTATPKSPFNPSRVSSTSFGTSSTSTPSNLNSVPSSSSSNRQSQFQSVPSSSSSSAARPQLQPQQNRPLLSPLDLQSTLSQLERLIALRTDYEEQIQYIQSQGPSHDPAMSQHLITLGNETLKTKCDMGKVVRKLDSGGGEKKEESKMILEVSFGDGEWERLKGMMEIDGINQAQHQQQQQQQQQQRPQHQPEPQHHPSTPTASSAPSTSQNRVQPVAFGAPANGLNNHSYRIPGFGGDPGNPNNQYPPNNFNNPVANTNNNHMNNGPSSVLAQYRARQQEEARQRELQLARARNSALAAASGSGSWGKGGGSRRKMMNSTRASRMAAAGIGASSGSEDEYDTGWGLGGGFGGRGRRLSEPDGWVDNEGVAGLREHAKTEEELKEFFKKAVDGGDFEGNATVSESAQYLGLDIIRDRHNPHNGRAQIKDTSIYLMPHQIVGVHWMMKQEKEDNKGGILGDEMGLGKTIQSIATFVLNRPLDDGERLPTLVVSPLALLHQWKEEIEKFTAPPEREELFGEKKMFKVLVYHSSGEKPKSVKKLKKYDIIVTTYDVVKMECPLPPKKKKKGKGKSRPSSSEDDDDAPSDDSDRLPDPGLLFYEDMKFHRIILDESQIIRNRNTKVSQSVAKLQSDLHWCLSGTPITNSLCDIYPMLRFLRIRPFDWKEYQKHIASLEKKNPETAGARLQKILQTCMIRRRKDSKIDGVGILSTLPKKEVHNSVLEFSKEEREIYDSIEGEMQDKFNKYRKAGTVLKNFSHIFVMLLRLRQLCCHPCLVQEEANPYESKEEGKKEIEKEIRRVESLIGKDGVTKIEQHLKKLKEARENQTDSETAQHDSLCSICTEPLDDPVITPCCHLFCSTCLNGYMNYRPAGGNNQDQDQERTCPLCRRQLTSETIFKCKTFQPEEEREQDKITTSAQWKMPKFLPSTKQIFLMEKLKEWQESNPDDKVLIISQWTSNLSLVSEYLTQNSLAHVTYEGSMGTPERIATLERFEKKDRIKYCLMSLKCGGVGLNLTRANRVINLDLAWAPAIEDQAFSRVHRIGQEKEVTVLRPTIANTVEERVLALQQRKSDLTDASLGEGGGKKLGKLSVKEMAELFGL